MPGIPSQADAETAPTPAAGAARPPAADAPDTAGATHGHRRRRKAEIEPPDDSAELSGAVAGHHSGDVVNR
ncbi:hypothetical protein [Polymorphospora lycopeni]|uniref:Uncharacterized protein n=1 Tax=Polymorphospora lycopeni TaxID=3140240 RepID=A0ABV5CPD1_9ACTN